MTLKDYLIGHYTPENGIFQLKRCSTHYGKAQMWLHEEAYTAYKALQKKAFKDGIVLKIISSVRNFERQAKIWNNKWNGVTLTQGIRLNETAYSDFEKAKAILKYSAMPCTSRHHWGTDIDLNSVEPEYFLTAEGQLLYQWLCKHAPNFGFYQVYDDKSVSQRLGYEEEKWHWSYLPIANKYLEAFNNLISYKDLKGFEGAHCAEALEVISIYVNGVTRY